MPDRRFRRADLAIPADELAPRLLGCSLVRTFADGTVLRGVIVEVEAYLGPADQASHARDGRRSPRNESMYARPGTAYVYFTYGMHHCMNIVCAEEGLPHAVLIRALAPADGIDRMRALRTGDKPRKRPLADRDLCSGPGKLCQAMAIDRSLDRADLLNSTKLALLPPHPGDAPGRSARTPRIGLGECGAWAERRLRWVVADSAYVSTRQGLPRAEKR